MAFSGDYLISAICHPTSGYYLSVSDPRLFIFKEHDMRTLPLRAPQPRAQPRHCPFSPEKNPHFHSSISKEAGVGTNVMNNLFTSRVIISDRVATRRPAETGKSVAAQK